MKKKYVDILGKILMVGIGFFLVYCSGEIKSGHNVTVPRSWIERTRDVYAIPVRLKPKGVNSFWTPRVVFGYKVYQDNDRTNWLEMQQEEKPKYLINGNEYAVVYLPDILERAKRIIMNAVTESIQPYDEPSRFELQSHTFPHPFYITVGNVIIYDSEQSQHDIRKSYYVPAPLPGNDLSINIYLYPQRNVQFFE